MCSQEYCESMEGLIVDIVLSFFQSFQSFVGRRNTFGVWRTDGCASPLSREMAARHRIEVQPKSETMREHSCCCSVTTSNTQQLQEAMATLMPSLSSDEEKDPRDEESSDEEDDDEINNDFEFGGVLVCIQKI